MIKHQILGPYQTRRNPFMWKTCLNMSTSSPFVVDPCSYPKKFIYGLWATFCWEEPWSTIKFLGNYEIFKHKPFSVSEKCITMWYIPKIQVATSQNRIKLAIVKSTRPRPFPELEVLSESPSSRRCYVRPWPTANLGSWNKFFTLLGGCKKIQTYGVWNEIAPLNGWKKMVISCHRQSWIPKKKITKILCRWP